MARKKTAKRGKGLSGQESDVARMSRHVVGLSAAIRLQTSDGLVARGHDLRPSTAQVIPNLPAEGLRVSDLAARLRLTLQRTGQLVSELEEVGYLERIPDPDDGRAKRVVYTRRGTELVHDIDEITADITSSFEKVLGTDRFHELCGLLAELDVSIHGANAPVRVVSRVLSKE